MIEGDKLPTLTGTRVLLRWLEDRDVPALFDVFSDQKVMRFWSSTPWTDPAEGISMIKDLRRFLADGSLFQWGVAHKSDDLVIGTCTLAHIDAKNRRAEIGFALRSDHWGQGYMTEATSTLLAFAFGELNLHRIEADVDPRNKASIRLLEKLGFQREGYLRERWLVNAEVCDTVFFGLLRRDWTPSA